MCLISVLQHLASNHRQISALKYTHTLKNTFGWLVFLCNIKCSRARMTHRHLICCKCPLQQWIQRFAKSDQLLSCSLIRSALFLQGLKAFTDTAPILWRVTGQCISACALRWESLHFPFPFMCFSVCVALAITAIFQDNNCQTRLIIFGVEGVGASTCWWGERRTYVINGTVMEK